MKIVVDTSVIIAVIANEPERDKLIELTRGADLIAPNSVHWEIGNAFSAMLKRKRITLEGALKAIEAYKKITINYVEIDIEKSLKIAEQLSLYAYDAYILNCALTYKSSLISLDQNLITHAKQMHIKIIGAQK